MTIGGAQNIFDRANEININFDWIDLASGTGYVSYDFHSTCDSVGIKRLLIETRNKSGITGITGDVSGLPVCITTGSDASGVLTKYLDIDWDSSEFQLPRTLKGKFFINFHMGNSVSNPASVYAIVKVRKWDGASETDLLTIQSNTIGFAVSGTRGIGLSGDLPQTNFKKGEQLRITIEAWGTSGGGTQYIGLSGQPDGSAESDGSVSMAANTTRIITFIPFKINN